MFLFVIPTERFLAYVSKRTTAADAVYIGIIALTPMVALVLLQADQIFLFGGAAILIIAGVGLETVKQISSQMERSYPGLMR